MNFYHRLSLMIFLGTFNLPAYPANCITPTDLSIWLSPRNPEIGQAFNAKIVSSSRTITALHMVDNELRAKLSATTVRGGPPWSITTRIRLTDQGQYSLIVEGPRGELGCIDMTAEKTIRAKQRSRLEKTWNAATESFFSAWIEQLFDGREDEELSFPSLQPVLQNPERNFLHGYLGQLEDDTLNTEPDCADMPYYLRAYFAWKVGLPFGYRQCNRGSKTTPPRCNAVKLQHGTHSVASFKQLLRDVANGVHSGNARTALRDDNTDFYPVSLTREALRPGTVYADPYGHILMVAKWIPQTKERNGLLLAVDAQPDNSVTRKRFWEGTFLFDDSVHSAGPGFKAFRPIISKVSDQGLRDQLLENLAISEDENFTQFSAEQERLTKADFYAHMSQLINPNGLNPREAYQQTIDALLEQLKSRVDSVDLGEKYMRQHPGVVVPMPDGAGIFETVGAWEDYATPSRDLRVLIAINVLLELPDRVARYPKLFDLTGSSPQEAKQAIQQLHEQMISEQFITYTRTDGSAWRLSVADILNRRKQLEMAYNPNDCVEVRWGARSGDEDYQTCKRHAANTQLAKMEKAREWFAELRRPTR